MLLLLGGSLIGGAHLGLQAQRDRRPPAVPYALPPELHARFPGFGDGGASTPKPRVIMYMAESCPFCGVELASWGRLVESHPELLDQVDVLIVTPAPVLRPTSWVPRRLRHSLVVDSQGRLASALKVNAVPFIAFVDRSGVVTHVVVGQSRPGRNASALAALVLEPPERGTERGDGTEG